ncbi:MAG: transposase [Chthoniobacterales bacterium]
MPGPKGAARKPILFDAAVLRAFGEAIQPAPTPPPSAQQRHLGELILRRRQLVEFVVAEANRSAHYAEALPRRQAAALLRTLRCQIAHCNRAIAALIAQDEAMAVRAARLTQVPGVDAVTAATLLAEMPKLDALSDQKAAALTGVAPYNCTSGPWEGTRRISGGRASVRGALYMARLERRPL